MFDPDVADRIVDLEGRHDSVFFIYGFVFAGLYTYFTGLFAADVVGLVSPGPIFSEEEDREDEVVGYEPAPPGRVASDLAEAYARYVAELASGGPGWPVKDDGDKIRAEIECVDERRVYQQKVSDLQLALAIASQLDIDLAEVVQYYASRARWQRGGWPASGLVSELGTVLLPWPALLA